MQAETPIVRDCLRFLEARGVFAWRNNVGAARRKESRRLIHYSHVGSSDILGVTPDGRFLAVECKVPVWGTLSEAQKVFLKGIAHNGGVAVVVRSWQELERKLKERGVALDGGKRWVR